MHKIRSCLYHMCHFVKMAWVGYRATIRFLSLGDKSTPHCHKRLSIVYGKSTPCYAPVTSRLREFRKGRGDAKDEHHSGRQITQSAEENVQKLHVMIYGNWKIGIESIIQEKGLSMDIVHTVAREHLSISKLCARSVSGMSTPKMKMP